LSFGFVFEQLASYAYSARVAACKITDFHKNSIELSAIVYFIAVVLEVEVR
jgi:hypothetical protein